MTQVLPAALADHAQVLLAQVLQFEYAADAVVAQYVKRHRQLGARDRALLADVVFGCLRHLRRVERAAGEGAAGEGADAAAWVDAWARGVWKTLDDATLSFAEACDMPDWLVEDWPWTGDAVRSRAMADAFNQPAPLDLRVNALRHKPEAARAALAADGIETMLGQFSPVALRVIGKPALQRHSLMADGSIEIQDEGSQLLALLLAPRRGEQIVDFCAGAGGKALQMAAMMRNSGRVHAFDVSSGRLSELALRARRAGASNIAPMALQGENDPRLQRLAGKADRVLVDAPCSGLGTLRRSPDRKWRQSRDDVADHAAAQTAILAAAAQLVRPGGVLVYATCSMLAMENTDVVEAFLAAQPGFDLEAAAPVLTRHGVNLPGDGRATLHLNPLDHGTDAFFAARMVRSA